jgi:hypothetical protein
MVDYEQQVKRELEQWKHKMLRNPSLMNRMAKRMQTRVNNMIPEKVHQAITATIRQMIHGVLFSAKHTTAPPLKDQTLAVRESLITEKIIQYRKTAAVEGGVTGAGGILMGLADFPLLIGIKIKLLYSIASLYGYTIDEYKERVYLLYIFQLAFSSQEQRTKVYRKMTNWSVQSSQLPGSLDAFDWRTFQQEYRDHIDLAKMAQLVPLIGAPVGFVVNYRLIKKLGDTAMNAYRMRWFEEGRDKNQ